MRAGKLFAGPTETLIALIPASERARNRWSSLAVSASLDRSSLPSLAPSLDWVSEKLWKLQGMGDYPVEARLDTLSLQARPALAKALLKQSGKFSEKSPIRIFADKDNASRLTQIQKQISSALGISVIQANRKTADWILESFESSSWSLDLVLSKITGDRSWMEWGEIPLNDPRKLSLYLEKARGALIEKPVLIPVGFATQDLRIKAYLNPPPVLGTGEIDLARLSYDPQSLIRPRRKPQ
jgi:hypothetical protein